MQNLTMAVNAAPGAKKDPYEIRYADHPSTHSIMDFAGVYVLYLVLAVGLPETYAPSLLPPVVVLPPFLDDSQKKGGCMSS
jgi:hypothetical protein